MRIIHRGTKQNQWPKKVACDTCDSQLEVEEVDCRVVKASPVTNRTMWVECPVCGRHIYFQPNRKPTSQLGPSPL